MSMKKFSTLLAIALLVVCVVFAQQTPPVCDESNPCPYSWSCAPAEPTEGTTIIGEKAIECSNTDYTQWTVVPVEDAPTKFTRVAKCVRTQENIIIEIATEETLCTAEAPVLSFEADGVNVRECLPYGTNGTDGVYTTCPVASQLTDAEMVKFCGGHTEAIQQQCYLTYSYTKPTEPEAPEVPEAPEAPFITQAEEGEEEEETPLIVISTVPVKCVAPQLVTDYNCPVYLPKCMNKFHAPETEDDGEEEPTTPDTGDGEEEPTTPNTGDGEEEPTTPDTGPKTGEFSIFTPLHHDHTEVSCTGLTPECPSCSKDNIPLMGSWTPEELAPKITLRCYVKTPVTPPVSDPEDQTPVAPSIIGTLHSENDDPNFTYVLAETLTPAQRTICLRGGNLTQDPEELDPETPCLPIATCPYLTCRPAATPVDDETTPYTFANCYVEDLPCARTESFPVCLGTPDIQTKCFDKGVKAQDNTICKTITQYEAPEVLKPCEPTNCPQFSFMTDAIDLDEDSTDYNEEMTTDDVVIAIEGTVITATIANVELAAEQTWDLEVYKRTFEIVNDVKTFKYTKINSLTKAGLTTPSTTLTIDPTLVIGDYIVFRAQYDGYTMIDEDSTGDCEILDIAKVYPQNPTTCEEEKEEEETAAPEDGEGEAEKETPVESFVQQTAKTEEEEEEEEVSTKQKVGREKLLTVVDGCRLHFGEQCSNGSVCQKTTESTGDSYSCSTCAEAFTGATCSTCDLTNLCLNGSKPFVYVPPTPDTTPATAFRLTQTPPKVPEEEEEETIDDSSNGQCHCQCSKGFMGLYCQCSAIYGRIDFQSSLALNEGQTQDQWVTQITDEIATLSAIPSSLFNLYKISPIDKAFIVYQLSACATEEQTNQFFAALQTTPTPTPQTKAQIQQNWSTVGSNTQKLTAANQAGGVAVVSSAYDPSCEGALCSPDVTAPEYVPQEVTPKPEDPTKTGGGSNAWWIILIILLVVVLIIIIIAAIRFFVTNNKKKNFGTNDSSEDGLDMAELS